MCSMCLRLHGQQALCGSVPFFSQPLPWMQRPFGPLRGAEPWKMERPTLANLGSNCTEAEYIDSSGRLEQNGCVLHGCQVTFLNAAVVCPSLHLVGKCWEFSQTLLPWPCPKAQPSLQLSLVWPHANPRKSCAACPDGWKSEVAAWRRCLAWAQAARRSTMTEAVQIRGLQGWRASSVSAHHPKHLLL